VRINALFISGLASQNLWVFISVMISFSVASNRLFRSLSALKGFSFTFAMLASAQFAARAL
jgi:hypothetical protein